MTESYREEGYLNLTKRLAEPPWNMTADDKPGIVSLYRLHD